MSVATTPLTSAGLEALLTTLLERFETMRTEEAENKSAGRMRVPMQAEIRSLDFWRSIVAECLASFFFIFIVCGSFVPWSGHTPPAVGIALAIGFAVASLTLTFAGISGAHLNPVITLALLITRRVSPIKALLYIMSQGGGAIAGAALLYGVTNNGRQGQLGTTTVGAGLSEWQALGIELCLTFIITLVYLTTMDDQRRTLSAATGPGPLTLGLAYTACSLVALPSTGASFNPMRSLGPSFVMNHWQAHWVYWLGPIVGGSLAGILYEFIFNPFRDAQRRKPSIPDGDASSIQSEEDNYDDVKSTVANYQNARSQHYDQYRSAISPPVNPNPISPGGTIYNRQQQRMERAESVYGGTKSLYQCTKSPAPVRANLNRSQSVYAKSPPNQQQQQQQPPNVYQSRGAQLHNAQSTYLARNVDLIRTESIYAARPSNRTESVYGARATRQLTDADLGRETAYNRSTQQDRAKAEAYQLEPIYQTRREATSTVQSEPMYGRKPSYRDQNQEPAVPNCGPLSPSDTSKDSAYGSVHGNSVNQANADWANHDHEQIYNKQQQPPYHPPYNQPPPAPTASGPMYPPKFRTELVSPGGMSQQQQHSPSAFHSPVQY